MQQLNTRLGSLITGMVTGTLGERFDYSSGRYLPLTLGNLFLKYPSQMRIFPKPDRWLTNENFHWQSNMASGHSPDHLLIYLWDPLDSEISFNEEMDKKTTIK